MARAKAKVRPVGKTEERRRMFKHCKVKPKGCLAKNIGCKKTEHFTFNTKKKTVICCFDKKGECRSPFPRKEKKPVETASKKPRKSKEKEIKPQIKKPRRPRRKKPTQMEFEVSRKRKKRSTSKRKAKKE